MVGTPKYIPACHIGLYMYSKKRIAKYVKNWPILTDTEFPKTQNKRISDKGYTNSIDIDLNIYDQ